MELGLYSSHIVPTISLVTEEVVVAAALHPPRPIEVIRVGFVITTAITVTDVVATFRRRPTPGSAGAGATAETLLGTVTSTAASRAIGQMLFVDVIDNDELLPSKILPGEEVSLEITTGGTAGAGTIFVDYQARGLHKRDSSTAYFGNIFDSNPAIG